MENIPSDINFYNTAKLNKILNNEQISFQTSALCSHPVQTVTVCSEIAKHSQVRPFTGVSLQLVCEALQAAVEGKQSCSFSPTSQFSAEMCLCGCMTEEKGYQMPATCKTRPQPQLLNTRVLCPCPAYLENREFAVLIKNRHICLLTKSNC